MYAWRVAQNEGLRSLLGESRSVERVTDGNWTGPSGEKEWEMSRGRRREARAGCGTTSSTRGESSVRRRLGKA